MTQSPAGPAGPVGGDQTPGPLQLERAWHGLMYTMAHTQAKRAQTINSAALHLRQLMRAR